MPEETPTTSIGGCLLQLFWSLIGPGLLLAMGAMLIVHRPAFGTWPDVAFLGLAAAVALARCLDGRPPEARPSAAASRTTYLAVLAGAALLILAVAHLVAPRLG